MPISNFGARTAAPRVGVLDRVDGERVLNVRADVLPGVLVDDKVQTIREWLATADLDPRITVAFKGEDEEQQAAQSFLLQAFGGALFIIALILIIHFNSFYSTLLTLSAVVMSTIGAMIGLLVTRQPFGIVMCGIGVIALAGIVVKNNIILIDTYDQLKHMESSQRLAILRTSAQRLRPVLLTAVTTIFGLLPMIFQVNIDFITREITVGAPSTQWWTQLSTDIGFGLTFATILTLVVTPAALMLKVNAAGWLARNRRTALVPEVPEMPAPTRNAAE